MDGYANQRNYAAFIRDWLHSNTGRLLLSRRAIADPDPDQITPSLALRVAAGGLVPARLPASHRIGPVSGRAIGLGEP